MNDLRLRGRVPRQEESAELKEREVNKHFSRESPSASSVKGVKARADSSRIRGVKDTAS